MFGEIASNPDFHEDGDVRKIVRLLAFNIVLVSLGDIGR